MALSYTTKRLIGRFAAGFVQENSKGVPGKNTTGSREGSLAPTLEPIGKNQIIDVRRDYRWTMSNIPEDDLKEIPYVTIQEFKCTESSIKKQYDFYTQYVPDVATSSFGGNNSSKPLLAPYKNLWSHENPTGFTYFFPYFNKIGMELASEPWAALDSVGDSVKSITSGVGDVFGKKAKAVTDFIGKVGDLASKSANAALNMQYPSVGVTDRPKIFMAHNDRSINISFTLYNTYSEQDWADNRDLCYTLMSQNLFNKRDSTTGVPPVFYSVFIPGQYFCWAACMTNLKVEHLGNQRLIWNDYIIPDAYQVELTLTELVKPSKNQFEAVTSGDARKQVTVRRR